MGFFSKIGKGLKRVFRGIGKGIKSAAKKVGKFMDKIGIVGQIGLALILPGIGGFLGRTAGLMAGSGNALVSGIGKIVQAAGKFGHTVGNAFKTVTDGITSFVGKVGGGMVNKAGSLLGRDSLLLQNAPASVGEGFQSWMSGVAENASNITSPFKKVAESVTSELVEGPYRAGVERMRGGFEDSLPSIADDKFVVPDVNPLNGDIPFSVDLGKDFTRQIVDAETKNSTSLLQKAADYSVELAGKAADTFSDQLSGNLATGLAQRSGILPVPENNITSVTNVVPEFNHDSSVVNNLYSQAGINYGATYDNRILFDAANSMFQQRAA